MTPAAASSANPPALQLYTVRDQLAADRKGVLARVAGYGYGAAEPFGILDDPAGLAADLAAAGLAVCSVHAMPAGERAAAVIAAARTLGTDTVIVPYQPPERFADAASVRELAAELNGMAARLAGDGLRLGYHNHDFELASMIGGRRPWRCWPGPSMTGCCSRWTPTGRRLAARTCPRCWAASASGSATCMSRTAR